MGMETNVPRAGIPVRDGLHLQEGAEERPAQAGPAVLLPDAGGEGPPRLRRPGRCHPRQHVPPGARALAGMAEAAPFDHPAPRHLAGPAPTPTLPPPTHPRLPPPPT